MLPSNTLGLIKPSAKPLVHMVIEPYVETSCSAKDPLYKQLSFFAFGPAEYPHAWVLLFLERLSEGPCDTDRLLPDYLRFRVRFRSSLTRVGAAG